VRDAMYGDPGVAHSADPVDFQLHRLAGLDPAVELEAAAARHRLSRDHVARLEFEIEWAALTAEEREAFIALMEQRRADGAEVLEALAENVRSLQLLFTWQEGTIATMEFVEQVRGAVPDPLMD
jgi:hypothetical protein